MSFPASAANPSQPGFDDPSAGAGAVDSGDLLMPRAPDRPGPVTVQLAEELVLLAMSAAREEAGSDDAVGEYLGAAAEDEVAVDAAFVATDRGYRGWYWSVTLALIDPGRPTISEVVLLPGEQALLAPPWVPWDQRIRPGDVGVGDLLVTAPDDIRLVPGYVDSDDPSLKELAYDFGFGRERVLSREGRDDAAQRWHDGPFGPDSPAAVQAPANCVTCGFYVPLAGLLGMALGACANEYSPADGRVVDAEYGCGAHSQTVIDAPLMSASTDTVVDELTLEVHRRTIPAAVADEPDTVAAADRGSDAELDPAGEAVADSVVGDALPAGAAVVDELAAVDEQPAADEQAAIDELATADEPAAVAGSAQQEESPAVHEAVVDEAVVDDSVDAAGGDWSVLDEAAAPDGSEQDVTPDVAWPRLEPSNQEPSNHEPGAEELNAEALSTEDPSTQDPSTGEPDPSP